MAERAKWIIIAIKGALVRIALYAGVRIPRRAQSLLVVLVLAAPLSSGCVGLVDDMFRSIDHDGDGIDERNDCDDENADIGDKQEHEDGDGDEFGSPTVSRTAESCETSPGWVDNGDDCDDADPARYTEGTWLIDADQDGYGGQDAPETCGSERLYAAVGGDCDDTNSEVYPGALAQCDGTIDHDCDGLGDCPAPEGELTTADADVSLAGTDDMMLGTAVIGVPDWNGDGIPELALGVPGLGGSDPTGGLMVVLSPFNQDLELDDTVDDGEPVVVYHGEDEGDGAGAVLATTDLDDDGYADLVVGAPEAGSTSISYAVGGGWGGGGTEVGLGRGPKGYAYVVLGPVQPGEYTFDDFRSVTLKGAAAGGKLGSAMSPAGDVDGDGDQDLLLAAPYAEVDGASEGGAVYLVTGPLRGSGTVGGDVDAAAITGSAAYERLGMAVLGGLDLRGDGSAALVLGGPTTGEDGPDGGSVSLTGCAYVLYDLGSTGGAVDDLAWTRLCGAEGEGFAKRLASAGDVDGDGTPDLLVGALNADPDGLDDAGAIYVYSGADLKDAVAGSTVTTTPLITLYGEATRSSLGTAMVGPGDIDLSGVDDLLIGMPEAVGDRGTVHLFYGPVSGVLGPAEADLIIQGSVSPQRAGTSMCSPGDLNGLGSNDLLIGGVQNNATVPGEAWLFLTDGL